MPFLLNFLNFIPGLFYLKFYCLFVCFFPPSKATRRHVIVLNFSPYFFRYFSVVAGCDIDGFAFAVFHSLVFTCSFSLYTCGRTEDLHRY